MGYIIEPTASAVTSQPFRVLSGETLPLVSSGLAGAEEITLQFNMGEGNWQTLGTSTSKLTVAQPEILVIGRGEYRAVKAATVGSASLSKGVL